MFDSTPYIIAFTSLTTDTVIEAFTAAGVIISEDDAAFEIIEAVAAGVSTVDSYTFRFNRSCLIALNREQKRTIASYLWASDDNAPA